MDAPRAACQSSSHVDQEALDSLEHRGTRARSPRRDEGPSRYCIVASALRLPSSGMFAAIRADLRLLKHSRPGRRFQDLHKHRKAQRTKAGAIARVLRLVLGTLFVVAGPVAGLVPGPGGILIFLLGMALLASELRIVARSLDWCEPRIRRGWSHVRDVWRRVTSRARRAVGRSGA